MRQYTKKTMSHEKTIIYAKTFASLQKMLYICRQIA